MRIGRLPDADDERPHGLTYRLFYGRDGERIIGYDNGRAKAEHRHYRDREAPRAFTTVEQVVADRIDDAERERSGK
ncbi:toxin-antitoxin system TumE family protein [Paraburkholderia madseniana]|uniref:toxin-antitoxin system TumE family protein n=1 Tax=Paraburkholderia madseniana TaxID=2599607 RepID=UPI001F452BF5|nr:DUF6516 family protein [Paraburkholderia madseniana]